jgi:hypothetical protein
MIPPVVMYALGFVLMLWGAYRVFLGRRPGTRSRRSHLIFGLVYVLMGLFLILTTSRTIPPPRFGSRAQPGSEVTPVYPIPRPPRAQPASTGSGPASQPASAARPWPKALPIRVAPADPPPRQ